MILAHRRYRLLRQFADLVQLSFKLKAAGDIRALFNKHLDKSGQRRLGAFPDGAEIDGHLPPAEHPLTLRVNDLFKGRHLPPAEVFIGMREHHAHPVVTGRRQRDPQCQQIPLKQRVGDLRQHARAVAGVLVRAARAPVAKVFKHRQGVIQYIV
ncbi:hypothetical protein SDC9_124577 [bioreactor metagenome]|uniref:Uncharacterized protein n=1 Tax=bioreactor metagenome TaxID=1076179 RepID=A0A645CKU2_9ZZZZ